jgi:hypothetical protein
VDLFIRLWLDLLQPYIGLGLCSSGLQKTYSQLISLSRTPANATMAGFHHPRWSKADTLVEALVYMVLRGNLEDFWKKSDGVGQGNGTQVTWNYGLLSYFYVIKFIDITLL